MILDNSMLKSIPLETMLKRRPKNLESLKRYTCSLPNHWPVPAHVSCSHGLYVYYKLLLASGQRAAAFDITHLCRYIVSRWNKIRKHVVMENETDQIEDYADDFFRRCLKHISSLSYQYTFERGPAYMLFSHLHTLTGKCPFTKQQIIDDVTAWVSDRNPDGSKKSLDKTVLNEVLDEAFSTWRRGEPYAPLSFKDYCNDFLRYGTNGGGPKVELYGSQYRTKWAWAVRHSTDSEGRLLPCRDLYSQSLLEKQTASVALKEEAAKTREVITTPMSSYLRQSYLWYRWGKPNIPSPISRSSWVNMFEEYEANWYGCVDGDRFDHTIPKGVILDVIQRFGMLDVETMRVAVAEIDHLKNLRVEWGDHSWEWKGGLLSGWRFTSILGSLISLAAARYILKKSGSHATNTGVMGDDLVLYSNVDSISRDDLVEFYNQFGLVSNKSKTVTGRVGEFLRKVRSKGGSWGFPTLALRTLVYANPWVSKYTYEREEEVSGGWFGVLSRLIPHSTTVPVLVARVKRFAADNLTQLFGKRDWIPWLDTPMSAGGGGATETSAPNDWYTLERERKTAMLSKKWIIPTLLGITKRKVVQVKDPCIVAINLPAEEKRSESLMVGMNQRPSTFRKDKSMTECVYAVLSGAYTRADINSCLTGPLPSGLRLASRTRLIEWLLVPTSGLVCNSSIFHTKESVSSTGQLTRYLTQTYMNRHPSAKPARIRAATTILYMQLFGSVERAYGTW